MCVGSGGRGGVSWSGGRESRHGGGVSVVVIRGGEGRARVGLRECREPRAYRSNLRGALRDGRGGRIEESVVE